VRRLFIVVPLLLAACGAATVPAADVADDAEQLLEEEVGVRPDITCPADIVVEVGASLNCVLTAGDDPTEYAVTVTVAAVEDDEPRYSVEVDQEPLG
jgi:hypothetical protein